jgi:hypothetical protein
VLSPNLFEFTSPLCEDCVVSQPAAAARDAHNLALQGIDPLLRSVKLSSHLQLQAAARRLGRQRGRGPVILLPQKKNLTRQGPSIFTR